MGFNNFFSFTKGIQEGFQRDNFPVLTPDEIEIPYSRAFSALCASHDGTDSAISAGEEVMDEVSQFPNIEDASAYWISPEGGILSKFNVHIEVVCDNPGDFGLTRKYMKGVYREYNEPWRLEGLARDEIMKLLYRRGWVRIRYVTSQDLFQVELQSLTNNHKNYLWEWANGLLKSSGDRYKTSQVFISEHSVGQTTFQDSFLSVASDKLFNCLNMSGPGLIPVSSSSGFRDVKASFLQRSLSITDGNVSVLEKRNLINSSNEPVSVDKEDYSCWISPQGEIHYLNGSIHYLFLLRNLGLFGLSEDFVREAEKKHTDEATKTINSVGLCDYLHMQAFLRGWTRVRDQRRWHNFSVEFHNIRIAENVLFDWASLMVKKGRGSCDVLIYCWELQKRFKNTVKQIATSTEALFQSAVLESFNERASRIPTILSGKPIKAHPSIRYFVACYMVPPSRRHLVKSSLCGSLDSFLYQNYMAGFGDIDPTSFVSDIKDAGDNGKVSLRFETNSGYSTEVDMGVNVDSGYLVESIMDELGLFPEGIVEGDLLNKSVVQEIVKSQGERDRQDRINKSDPPELEG